MIKLAVAILLLLTVSCTGIQQKKMATDTFQQQVSVPGDDSLLAKHAPIFILEGINKSYNRIGTPTLRDKGNGKIEAYIDPQQPTIYAQEQKFTVKDREYTNLIYRIHFEKIPYKHLTAGKNIGLIVTITIDKQHKPLLLTTVHTCGCYLAIIPTSNLTSRAYPPNWSVDGQNVYGERLPSLIEMQPTASVADKFVVRIRGETHRVMDIRKLSATGISTQTDAITAIIKPMEDLRKLPFGDTKISFFETQGRRKGYVRNSHKPFERLLMSWWSMDWRIGEDKDLGPSKETGTLFYTSLKFWAWERSDLWHFADFLEYWGWEL